MTRSSPVVLCALNARYSHTSLALRSLMAYVREQGHAGPPMVLDEFSINDQLTSIIQTLYARRAAVYAFSCYIWNIQMVRRISRTLKKIQPDALVLWGGPEAGFMAHQWLTDEPAVDMIICGEGERAFDCLYGELSADACDYARVPSLVWRDGNRIVENPPVSLLSGDQWPFAYTDSEIREDLSGRMIYYESSRGCPFSCSYCISALDRTVRFRPLKQVFADLDRLIAAHPRQVKLVDRTFNCNPDRAYSIWKHLIDNAGQGCLTNFHFEIAGDLIDDAAIDLLKQAPKGLIQLEIGVQTIQPDVLSTIRRKTDIARLGRQVEKLVRSDRIHLHMDLIAGLPGESLQMFSESVDFIMKIKPQQFQLGFLKILPGSPMQEQAREFGFCWDDEPPYEILKSDAMDFNDLSHLKHVEKMIDFFVNAGFVLQAFRWLMGRHDRPWLFLSGLAAFAQAEGWLKRPLRPADRCRLLYDYAQSCSACFGDDSSHLAWLDLLRLDYQLSGQKDQPDFLLYHESKADPDSDKLIKDARRLFRDRHPDCGRMRVDCLHLDLEKWNAHNQLLAGKTLVCLDMSGRKPEMLDKARIHDLY